MAIYISKVYLTLDKYSKIKFRRLYIFVDYENVDIQTHWLFFARLLAPSLLAEKKLTPYFHISNCFFKIW